MQPGIVYGVMDKQQAHPGDPYWIVMGDAPPVLVESGVISADGERIPDPVPYWRKSERDWTWRDWLRAWWRGRSEA